MDVEKLKSLIREDYEVIDANETISKVVPMLEKWESKSAILVEENGEVIGVIRERDLLRGCVMVNPHETKIKHFVIPTGILSLDDLTPEKVARRFVEDSTPFVVVRLNGRYGVINIDDFLNLLKSELSDVRAKDVMNPEVITVLRDATVAKALATMRTNGVDRVVIIDENYKVVGIITGKDIIDRIFAPRKKARTGDFSGEKEKSLSIKVESIMSYPVITAEKNDSISEIIDKMIENNISSVVITKDGFPEGIVIKKDILEYYLKQVTPVKYTYQVVLKDVELDEFEMDRINKDLENFLDRFKEYFGEAILFVYMKRHKEFYRGLPLIYVRLKLASDKGVFFATGEGWGAEYALHAGLRRLERTILEHKDLQMDKKMIKRFYEDVFSDFVSI
ncbi:CBS domain-containing protein [Archaeoglobus profundus]|uniref:Signal transduction protein with CBS domains n=1 Tax=Archaeoglobus profundus (strain DSM 5631 / JCM 9629 / NBRC 100127 / Av18) TaxID=572546 RepID=D2RG92_ARCPA|nr:CBS domain-containing protein [Archaeoglobus profundus]ADB57317.1 putative signal transduction protein with CBS domains [Archaeoglobus profundus DSM 5631]